MGAAIGLREDFGSVRVRALARTVKDAGQARRLLALAVIYDGGRRTEAAKIGSVGLQIIRDWVLRFNARGPDAPEVLSQTDRCTHGEPPLFAILIQRSGGLGIPKMSHDRQKLV